MDKTKALQELELLKQKVKDLENVINSPAISAEQRMTEIWRSCNNVKYSSDDCRTYFKDNQPMFQQDWKNKKLYYRYLLVYKIFEDEFNMTETEINKLVITTLSKDLNCSSLEGRAEEGLCVVGLTK